MPEPTKAVLRLKCPTCQSHLRVPVAWAGSPCECPHCGGSFLVPNRPSGEGTEPRQTSVSEGPMVGDPSVSEDIPTIPVICPVCETRMYARDDQVGKRLKCPDCFTMTVVPAPATPRQETSPSVQTDQDDAAYELWEGVDQPPADDPIAHPVSIPVSCRLCETHMVATGDQAGSTITCPDCGTATVVPPLTCPKPAVSSPIDDGPELELSDPIVRPEVSVLGLGSASTAKPIAATVSGQPARAPTADRPSSAPRLAGEPRSAWTLVSGLFLFPFSRHVWTRWLALSLGLSLVLGLLAEVVGLASGAVSKFSALGIAYTAIFGVVALIWTIATAAHAVRIIEATAYGRDEVDWPGGVWIDWLGESLYVINSLMYASVSTIAAGWLLTLIGHSNPIASGAVGFLLFPIILLSMLETGSPMLPVSAAVLGRLFSVWWAWAIVYVQQGLIGGVTGVVAWTAYRAGGPHALIPVAPLVVAAIWIDARLLGRLARYLTARDQSAAVAENGKIQDDS